MRVLVCGGRDFENKMFIFDYLDDFHSTRPIEVLIEGAAKGADELAGTWADMRGVQHLSFPANWNKYRAAAGPIRNKQMLDEGKPDIVVAFPGGKGTANMVEQASSYGVPVETASPCCKT